MLLYSTLYSSCIIYKVLVTTDIVQTMTESHASHHRHSLQLMSHYQVMTLEGLVGVKEIKADITYFNMHLHLQATVR